MERTDTLEDVDEVCHLVSRGSARYSERGQPRKERNHLPTQPKSEHSTAAFETSGVLCLSASNHLHFIHDHPVPLTHNERTSWPIRRAILHKRAPWSHWWRACNTEVLLKYAVCCDAYVEGVHIRTPVHHLHFLALVIKVHVVFDFCLTCPFRLSSSPCPRGLGPCFLLLSLSSRSAFLPLHDGVALSDGYGNFLPTLVDQNLEVRGVGRELVGPLWGKGWRGHNKGGLGT